MRIRATYIPEGYKKKDDQFWGNWASSSSAYLERRILMRYHPNKPIDYWLVYYDGNRWWLLEQVS